MDKEPDAELLSLAERAGIRAIYEKHLRDSHRAALISAAAVKPTQKPDGWRPTLEPAAVFRPMLKNDQSR